MITGLLLMATSAAMFMNAAQPAARSLEPGGRASLCQPAVKAINAAAAKTMAQGSPGMIVEVAHGDHTLFSGSYGIADLEQNAPVRRDSVFQLASITKIFTAAVILSLFEEGRLSLNDRISKHLPSLPATTAGVRVYDLLVQTSGIPDFSEDPELTSSRSIDRTTSEMVSLIGRKALKLDFQAGTRWRYSNSNYVLLGAIAERVTGKSLETIFAQRLLGPAGLRTIRFDHRNDVVRGRVRGYRRDPKQPSGFANAAWISPTVPGAAGGLRGTAPDLIRWSNALFGATLLRPTSVRLMTAPGRLKDGRTTKLGMPDSWQKGLNSDYGMGVFIKQTAAGTRFSHSGDIDGFSTWLAHYPQSGVTIVQMINSESADLNVDAVEAAVFPSAARPCLGGEP